MSGPTCVPMSRGMADAQHAGRADQPLDDLVVHAVDHDQPRAGRALLAGVAEGRVHHGGHRLVEVGVGVDDDRVLAAHLGDHPLHLALPGRWTAARSMMRQPDRLRAGEGDEGDVGVLDEVGADLLADPGQEGEAPRRQPAGIERLDERVRHERRLLGRLEASRRCR